MSKRITYIIIVSFIIITTLAWVEIVYSPITPSNNIKEESNISVIKTQIIVPTQKDTTKEIITKDIKSSDVITLVVNNRSVQLPIFLGDSLYETLTNGQKAGLISFSGKNYLGLGFFITDIGQLYADNNKNLFYYVNDKEASWGISSYIPKSGDIIRWELK